MRFLFYFHFPVPLYQTLWNVAFERHLASTPCAEIPRLTVIQSIRLLKRILRCQLWFAIQVLRDHTAWLGMLTYPLVLLSKPVSPYVKYLN